MHATWDFDVGTCIDLPVKKGKIQVAVFSAKSRLVGIIFEAFQDTFSLTVT